MPLRTGRVSIFDKEEARDTVIHKPPRSLDLTRAWAWGFEVLNDCNQDVLVQLVGGQEGGNVGASTTIAANTREPIATTIWAPSLSLSYQFVTAPTTGTITIRGWAQIEETPGG